jgi:hypothetical protein
VTIQARVSNTGTIVISESLLSRGNVLMDVDEQTHMVYGKREEESVVSNNSQSLM